MSSSWENVKVDGSNMRTYVSAPEGSSKVPAIVIVQGQTGVDDFVQFTRMVASEGFVGAAPDLYHRDPADCKDDPPTRRMRLTDRTLIADVNATVDFLKSHAAVDSARIGIVGFCMGGRAVYLMSAVNPNLKAGVMYYGSDPFQCLGRGAVAVRAHGADSLPDHGPLRRRRQESITGGYAQTRRRNEPPRQSPRISFLRQRRPRLRQFRLAGLPRARGDRFVAADVWVFRQASQGGII